MAKKIYIEVSDDQDTDSCDIIVKITPSMDKETFDKMKNAIKAALPRVLNNGWKEFTSINQTKN